MSVLATVIMGVALAGSAAEATPTGGAIGPDDTPSAVPRTVDAGMEYEGVVVIDANVGPVPGETTSVPLAVNTGCGTNPRPGSAYTVDLDVGVQVHLARPCQWLDRGRNWYFGHARLTMQTDGNLVLYDNRPGGRARWASGTNGSGATQMMFQPDGNLVVYTAGWAQARWASHTDNDCAVGLYPYLGLQSDSNFVIYCGYFIGDRFYAFQVPWATNTVF